MCFLSRSGFRLVEHRGEPSADSERATNLVGHQSRDGSSDLMVRLGFPLRSQQDEEESGDQREDRFTGKP